VVAVSFLVHTRTGRVPRTHAVIEINIPWEVSVEYCAPDQLDYRDAETTRKFGDQWHVQGRSLVLVVPSVAASGLARNILINADHPEAVLLQVSDAREVIWDSRLFAR
jgi:RES domain-containing protein